jgi:hypothetical protein
MGTKAMGGGKTNVFASIVYEDCIVNNEVINDTLSPTGRWMPWTQRAFIFNTMHPLSELMVGVLDYDSPAPMATHDPIGGASVDIANLRPKTEYTLSYNLYMSTIVKKRKSNGSRKLWIRLEVPNERKAIMAGLQPPPQVRNCRRCSLQTVHSDAFFNFLLPKRFLPPHCTLRREEKRYMFGEYLAVVPRFKEEWWVDISLAASYASPHVAGESYADIVCRKYGQHLTGEMIPRR